VSTTPVTVLSVQDGQSTRVFSERAGDGNIEVKSHTSFYTDFWIVYPNGKEQKLTYGSSKVKVRDGQMLSLITDERDSNILAILNHNTLVVHILIDKPSIYYGLAKKSNAAGYYYLLLLAGGIAASIYAFRWIDDITESDIYPVSSVIAVSAVFLLAIFRVFNHYDKIDNKHLNIDDQINKQLLQIANMDMKKYE
jgi:hypothetical protein